MRGARTTAIAIDQIVTINIYGDMIYVQGNNVIQLQSMLLFVMW